MSVLVRLDESKAFELSAANHGYCGSSVAARNNSQAIGAPRVSAKLGCPLRDDASSKHKRVRLTYQLPRFRNLIESDFEPYIISGSPKGIRIPVSALRGRRPWPLDDGAVAPGQGLEP